MSAFFYGTLQSNTVMLRVLCGPDASPETLESKLATLKLRPAVIKGYKRHALKNLDYPGVVKSDRIDSSVTGVLCEGLSRFDIMRLDAFEGEEYERVSVTASTLPTKEYSEIETEVPTQLYLWTAGHDHLEDREWELEKFIQGTQVAWMTDRCEFKMVDQLELTTQV